MTTLKSICVELDGRILEYFNVLDEVHAKQHELNTLLQDGFILMAKARYTMGSNSVSTLQFNDHQMEASVRVDVDSGGDAPTPTFTATTLADKPDDTDGNDGLRHRAGGVEELSVKSDEEPTTQKKDPLKWFGVLVPGALRESQGKFRRAAELSCELATLKQRVDDLRQKCRSQLVRKENIMNGIETLS